MTLYARTDNRRCFVSCGQHMKDAGLCICNNRFTNNMWRVVDECRLQNEANFLTLHPMHQSSTTIDPKKTMPTWNDYDFIYDAPLTC